MATTMPTSLAPARNGVEREVKLAAWAGFSLPNLEGIVDGITVEPMAARTLDAVYYDTSDLRLARWGITLRFRDGDGAGWTVKLSDGGDGPVLARRELTFAAPPGTPPVGAADLVSAYVRTSSLVPVARLRTKRQGVQLRDEEGCPLAEVVCDEVSVLEGRRVAARFLEVEAEITGQAPADLLDGLVSRLRAAGAGDPDPTPKLIHALGAKAAAPPEIAVPTLPEECTAGDVVRLAIARSVTRVLRHDPGVRIGDDPEDVHQARVGTRRLRSDLRTFAPLLSSEWATPLREELRWIASALGEVRDADVLTERLRGQATDLPEVDAAGFAPVLRRLADEREGARTRLLATMRSERYLALLDRLVAAANDPQLVGEAGGPAQEVVPELVLGPWRQLRRAVRRLPSAPSDEDLHGVRIRTKRARYAAEAAIPVFGKKARRFSEAVAAVQGVLGNHHDAVVAESWLRAAVAEANVPQALVLGELLAAQRAEVRRCRREWRDSWKKANKKKLRAWLA
ncbi:MAG: CYTH and CHAD domain-containing protein [Actinomycetota bacterium]|nr:CYTH and CHAD domain-containing protein [Actinomycetota bacterium]